MRAEDRDIKFNQAKDQKVREENENTGEVNEEEKKQIEIDLEQNIVEEIENAKKGNFWHFFPFCKSKKNLFFSFVFRSRCLIIFFIFLSMS